MFQYMSKVQKKVTFTRNMHHHIDICMTLPYHCMNIMEWHSCVFVQYYMDYIFTVDSHIPCTGTNKGNTKTP